jgi:hypothetical protein
MDVLCIRPILATIADPAGGHYINEQQVTFEEFWRRGGGPIFFVAGILFPITGYGFSAWPELVTLSVRRSADRFFIELPILWNVGLASFVLLGLDSFRYLLSVLVACRAAVFYCITVKTSNQSPEPTAGRRDAHI